MGKKSAPSVTPVDPVATSNAQSAANIATAQAQQKLNMVGTTGPGGTVNYQEDATQPGGYRQVTTLSPGQQGIYDASNAAQTSALGIANQQIGRVGNVLGQQLDTSRLPALVGSVGGQQPSYGSPAGGKQPGVPNSNNQAAYRDALMSLGSGQPAASGSPAGGKQPGGVAPGGAQPAAAGSPGGGKQAGGVAPGRPTGSGQFGLGGLVRPENASTGAQQGAQGAQPFGSFSPPPRTPQSPQLPSTTGIQGSFDKGAQLQYGFDPGQGVQGHVGPADLNMAALQAQNAAYGQATSRLNPQFSQSENELRTKLANQGLSQNDTAYATALQNFQQGKNDAYQTAENSAVTQGNTAAQQLFDQALQQGQFSNQAAAQMYGQNQGQAAFHNQTAGQDYSQNLGSAQFGNEAQQQQYGQQAQNFQLQQGAQNQSFNQGMAAQNQGFNQGLANAQLSNTARQQGLQEQAYVQNQPLNQFNSLLSAGQVQMPTGIQYTPSQVANTDVLGAYALNQQGQIANAQMKSAANSGLMGGLFGLGSAALMAGPTGGASLLKASDRRLKRDIRKIGRRPDGINLYEFRYIGRWDREIGVMAQEVQRLKPHAVATLPSGFLAVDYSALDLEAA